MRSRTGIHMDVDPLIPTEGKDDSPIHAIFYLISPSNDPQRHLRILAQLATHIDSDDFAREWLAAHDEHDLRQVLVRADQFITIGLHKDKPTGSMIGHPLRDAQLPSDCLVALIRRGTETVIPRGHTILEHGDWLTVLGEPDGIRSVYQLATHHMHHGKHQTDLTTALTE